MNMEEGLEEAVRRAVDGVVRLVGVKRPAEEKIRGAGCSEGVQAGGEETQSTSEDSRRARLVGPRLLPELDLEEVLEE